MRALLSILFLLVVLYGCAGERTLLVSDPVPAAQQTAVVPHTDSARLEGRVPPDQVAGEGETPAQRGSEGRRVATKRSILGEASGREQHQMSLLIRQEDGSEDDITLLLSPDYLRQFDIPIVFNDAVQYFVKHFTVEKRRIFVNWLRRSKRYVPMIREILRDHKLPEDLIYLAMIESGFNPKAYSPMKASGPWQFIYATGGRYGLRVNHWIDERRDPEKSTVAAALYLKDLFNQFGSWYLAAAGYNAGEKRIERAIEKHETGDFWELSKYNALPRETREYIPRLIAAAIIAKDPEKFGMTNINYDRPICFLNEKVPGGTSLAAIAAAASADVVTIRSLNPEILTGITPPDMEYAVKLPETVNREAFRANLQTALNKEKKIESIVAYTFKKRDSLTRITKRYNVSVSDLMLVNNCDQELKVKPGVTVYIPNFSPRQGGVEVVLEEPASKSSAPSSARAEEMRAGRKAVKPAQSDKKTASRIAKGNSGYHIVKKGESLTGISEKYGIDLATLKAINRIRKDHISPNMRLELVSHARTSAKPKQVYHVVKKGESLSSIAERYGADIESVKKTNRLKQGKIRVGLKLKIPAPRSSVTDRAAPPAG